MLNRNTIQYNDHIYNLQIEAFANVLQPKSRIGYLKRITI